MMFSAIIVNWIDVCTLVSVIVAGVWSIIEWHETGKTRRAEMLSRLLELMRTEDMREFFYRVEYGDAWYNEDFHGSAFEKSADSALSIICDLCYLKEQGLIGKKEAEFFLYELDRILTDTQTIDYLYNLHHFAAIQGNKSSFFHLEVYAKQNGYITPKVFDDPNSYQMQDTLHKYLRW